MREDERVWAVKELLFDYVKSPSLRHIRDPHSLLRLAQEIVERIDRGNSIWRKWDGQREVLLNSALPCWIRVEDLRDFLNGMPGPTLTTTDVAQRLRAFEEEEYYAYPKRSFSPAAVLYMRKKGLRPPNSRRSSNFSATNVACEEERLRLEQEAGYQKRREEESSSAGAAPTLRRGPQMDPASEIAALVLPRQRPDVPHIAEQGQDVEPISGRFDCGRWPRCADREVPAARRCDEGGRADGISA